MTRAPDIILRNVRVYGARAGVTAAAITSGFIAETGRDIDVTRRAGPRTEAIDCEGLTLIPGIVDEHIHLFAAASARNTVDCRPSTTPTIETLIETLRATASGSGDWIRGRGYDDSPVGLGRHLTRHDLDAVSRDIPVRVEHRSGHAAVLNTAGLAAVGIERDTEDPPGGAIVRDARGEATGLLLDMEGWLRDKAGSRIEAGDFSQAIRDVVQDLLKYGITGFTDAGANNGTDRWQVFRSLVSDGTLPLRVTMMAGAGRLSEFQGQGLRYGDAEANGMLTLGHAKIMLTATSGGLHPDFEMLACAVKRAHDAGFPVAIHAVEREAIVASAAALSENPAPVGVDRIEHCAECPPDVAELVAASGAKVVLNTGFLHYDGERYRQTVSSELLPHLYPAGALSGLGVRTALGSDAPVVDPNPWAAMAAAITRRTASGNLLGGTGLPSMDSALAKHIGQNRIEAGQPADLAVVAPDPIAIPLRELPQVRAALTITGGQVVWRDGI